MRDDRRDEKRDRDERRRIKSDRGDNRPPTHEFERNSKYSDDRYSSRSEKYDDRYGEKKLERSKSSHSSVLERSDKPMRYSASRSERVEDKGDRFSKVSSIL